MNADRMVRVERAVRRVADESRSIVDLCRGLHDAVSGLVPADRWCGFSVDPATLFATNGYHDEGLPFEHFPRLLELEYGEPDSNQLRELARTPSGVATLTRSTNGNPEVSARWREILEPSGLRHELRALLREPRRDRGVAWGALVLLRADERNPFTEEEADMVARLAPAMAAGFRRVLVRQHLDHAEDVREAGVLVVGGDPLEVRSGTDAARAWLDQLDDGGCGGALPTSVLSAIHGCRGGVAGPVAARTRTRTGRWVTITAERMNGAAGSAADAEYGLVVQPSRPAEIAEIVGAAHQLTRRESDVVVLVAAGRSNREIAGILGVSPHTVDDHLKRIFTKLDVATRGEMTSKLYHDHYLPREAGGIRAGADGWYLPG